MLIMKVKGRRRQRDIERGYIEMDFFLTFLMSIGLEILFPDLHLSDIRTYGKSLDKQTIVLERVDETIWDLEDSRPEARSIITFLARYLILSITSLSLLRLNVCLWLSCLFRLLTSAFDNYSS